MTDPLIFYGYTPHKRRWECQQSVSSLEALEQAGYDVLWYPTREETDYATGLREVWRHPGPLVIIEHDMIVPVSFMDDLLACPEPICAGVYWIALGVAGRRPMLSACIGPLGTNGNPRVDPGASRAGYSAIGCSKIDQAIRQAMPYPNVVPWTDVEFEVNRAVDVAGYWHLHWPVLEHRHGFMEAQVDRPVIPYAGLRRDGRTDRRSAHP